MGRATVAVLLLAALAAGCDSDDDGDDSAGGDMTTGSGMTTGGGTDIDFGAGEGPFAEIFRRGPTDEPVDFDAAGLSTDLDAVFGTTASEPVDATGGDDADVDDTDRRRTASY